LISFRDVSFFSKGQAPAASIHYADGEILALELQKEDMRLVAGERDLTAEARRPKENIGTLMNAGKRQSMAQVRRWKFQHINKRTFPREQEVMLLSYERQQGRRTGRKGEAR
jgi:hypothetical protein